MLLSHYGGRMSIFITVTTREWEYAQKCVKTVERLKKRIQDKEMNEDGFHRIKQELQKILEGKE